MKTIKLDLITTDAGTPQRTISENVVREYMELMGDGHKFPAVDLVGDGTKFWLWNGFHRFEAAKRLQKKTLACAISNGTLEDALWLSCSANRDNGLPRTTEDKKHILLKLFAHEKWGKKSTSELARHVGVGRRFVTKIRSQFDETHTNPTEIPVAHGALGAHDSHEIVDANNKDIAAPIADADDSVEGAHGALRAHDSDTIEVTRGGKTYQQKKQTTPTKKQEQPPKILDKVGREIPHELIEVYLQRPVIEKLIRALDEIKNQVKHSYDAHDLIYSMLNFQSFQANMENLRRDLKFALPFAVCPYCGGRQSESCKACKGFGFVNSITYKMAPHELKLESEEIGDDN
jgi:hypothetical protein